jgi:two-component system OmpR family response regulator
MSTLSYVLVVEDDVWLAEHHVRTFAMAGLRAEAVPDALAALEAVDRQVPDALVLDIFLPGPNAFALLHELRSYADLATVPAVLCTASAETLAHVDLTAYGITRVLDKATMLPGDVVAAVKKVLA